MDQSEPVWVPSQEDISRTNVAGVASHLGLDDVAALHRWSVERRGEFWQFVVDRFEVVFDEPATVALSPDSTPDRPEWFPGARMNIVKSCFAHAPWRTAMVVGRGGELTEITYRELENAVLQFVGALTRAGVAPGTRIAIAMPMTYESVVAYLGIVAAGCVVVSIPDSISSEEIAVRLRIAACDLVVTQDVLERGGKTLDMYQRVVDAAPARCIVVETGGAVALRDQDHWWNDFVGEVEPGEYFVAAASAHTNILFSSGTTADPKAIPWSHLTPIKAAMDAYFHHDVHPDDVLVWPTNLGWMMGPWLIYSSLIHGAAFGLHDDQPTDRAFGEFVEKAGVTMLGLVPSLVSRWRSTRCMEGLDWSQIRRFSSTGEASNAGDMAWLMKFAGGRPLVEYCGGTELGGGYLASTLAQPNVPASFSTPVMGIDLRILDEDGRPADSGEIFLVPPSIGLSTELLNRNHHATYYEGTPESDVVLRRHGDHVERLSNGYFRVSGRVDDAMNLGGIKVGSAELERVITGTTGVAEVAAVAVSPPGGGPSRLVLYVVPEEGTRPDRDELKASMNSAIRTNLSPLFRVHDVVLVEALPRTASQKVMRRELRARYEAGQS